MFKTWSTLDERAVVFLPRKYFLLLCLGKKLVFFRYNFALGKETKKFQCDNIL